MRLPTGNFLGGRPWPTLAEESQLRRAAKYRLLVVFLWPSLIIRDESRQVVQVALQTLANIDGALTYGPLMLAAIIASVPPAIVFILMKKPFMSGFAVGQDK